MQWLSAIRRRIRKARGARSNDRLTRIKLTGEFHSDDVAWLSEIYFDSENGLGTSWEPFRDAHMALPDWFKHGLDPLGHAYAEQQHRLWRLISGVERPYEPEIDELEHDWSTADPIRTPSYFLRRDAQAVTSAGDHVLATGMFLKHCALKPGDWALEYGAGFGQTALAFARLGVNVDTVDLSTTFCEFVRQQGEFFKVPLTPFHGLFGSRPRPGQKYKLIWFYESFHHCLDFKRVVPLLRETLAENGRVILGGEPIVEGKNAAVPYPWGVRLHSEVVAFVRKLHWFELGFSEDFLFALFASAGFRGRRVECEPSLFGRLYVFELAKK